MPSAISKQIVSGLKVIELNRSGLKELFITATPSRSRGSGDLRPMFEDVQRVVHEGGAMIVTMDVFGIPHAKPAGLAALRNVWSGVNWPVTWLDEGNSAGMEFVPPEAGLTGVQVHAVKGASVERIKMNGRVVGSVFDDGFARHCHLGDLRPQNGSASPERQARETFELMEAALRSAGMELSNVARTWFYLDKILSWYGAFNHVRDGFFSERKMFDGLVPASTGIGGANAAGTVVIADAYAVQPHANSVKIMAVSSPLQCPALQYGSSFNRAVEVEMPDYRRLFISGTASIDPSGKTAHVGDLPRQIDLTMDVVAAILASRRMNWGDVTRAVAYVKQGSQAHFFKDYCAAHGLDDMPTVTTENDICRDELLFEIEVDACQTQ
jgi:enamine deaminase RidA (YjgF/YER057c/UK114 family)